MNKNLLTILAIALGLALFLGVNIVGAGLFRGARLDLTQGRLYTLSEGSRAIAKKIDEPIRVTLYYSETGADGRPDIKAYATRVREFLTEFAIASGGKIRFDTVNPEPFSEAEEQASAAGLMGAPTGRPGEKLFFGLLAVNSTDEKKTIPFFDPSREAFLEYDITRMVYLLANPTKATVGIMASLPINGMQNNPMMRGQTIPPWQVAAQLGELFDVKSIPQDAADIPAEVKVLMVVHPKSLSDKTQYAIDQFVLRGGRLLVFVDPWCEADVPPGIDPMQAMQIPKASSLPKLFEAWGIEMIAERWAADRDAAIRLQGQGGEPVDYLQFLGLSADRKNFTTSDIVTGHLQKVIMDIPGVLQKRPEATIAFEPLIQTGPRAQATDVKLVQFMPDPKSILTQFQPGDKPLTLAARVRGKVKTAFPAGDPAAPPPAEGQPPAPAGLTESTGEADIIVVADCDMLADRFWIQEQRLGNILLGYSKFADNGDFVIGAMDNLAGSKDLLALRARGKFARPFARVEQIQKAAEDKYLAKEQELQTALRQAEQRLQEIVTQAPQGGQIILTPEQQAEIAKTRAQVVDYRRQLRDVNFQLNKDIKSLGRTLQFLNMGLMPLAVGLLAIGLSVYRVNRRRTWKAAAAGSRT